MRVSEVFTMGGGNDRQGSYSDGGTNKYRDGGTNEFRNYYDDYEDRGYFNNNFNGFERGPTRRSLLGLLG